MANENLDIDSKTAEELYEWYLDDKLIINRRYQRKLVWSLEEKTALISSMTQHTLSLCYCLFPLTTKENP